MYWLQFDAHVGDGKDELEPEGEQTLVRECFSMNRNISKINKFIS